MILGVTLAKGQAQREPPPQPTAPRELARSLLADAIQDKNPDIRMDAAEAMSLMKTDDQVFHHLESMLDDNDVLVRIATVATLGSFKDKRAVAPLEKALHDPAPEVDFVAAKALFQLHDGHGKEFLLEVASGESKATSNYFTKKERDALRLLHTPAKLFTTVAISAVGFVPVPGIGLGVSSAQGILAANDSSARAAALLLLGHEKDAATADIVKADLTDKEWSVRAAAVHVVATHPYPALREDLIPLFDDKKDGVRLRAAAAYLALEKPPKQLPASKTGLKNDHP
jgi:HEAT repeat protein